VRRTTWFGWVVAFALAAGGVSAYAAGAPPEPGQPANRPQAATTGAAAGQVQLVPDIVVKSVWIGKGAVGQAFTPLGHNPSVGEPISLGCDVGISGTVAREAFKIAWYVDGVKTCGEGADTVQNPPVCEFTWPLAVGQKVFISYVPHQAGTHLYKCAVDVGNQVTERKETNNSQELSFTVRAALSGTTPAHRTPVIPRPKLGPKTQPQ
jgi:hypothetical protein